MADLMVEKDRALAVLRVRYASPRGRIFLENYIHGIGVRQEMVWTLGAGNTVLWRALEAGLEIEDRPSGRLARLPNG